MRIGGRKLNMDDGEKWLSDSVRAFIMGCYRVQPNPGTASYLT